MTLVIAGRIVPLDRNDPDAVFQGRVFIDDTGTVERVSSDGSPAPAGFATAPTIDVGDSFVLPGLIDLHNHIGYNTLPLWAEPSQTAPFAHHDSWTRAPSYQAAISWPAHALVRAAPEALLAYVQLRALAGGTTSLQGWPSANRKAVQSLRNVDDETAGTTSHDLIRTSALTLKKLDLGKIAQAEKQGAGFIYHCAEGQPNSRVRREFIDASDAGCLGKTFIGIHCSAVTGDDWKLWDKAKAGTMVWSPFSNFWLYGSTADIAAARSQNVAISIGSDWGPSGSKNVQGELKVARLASQRLGLGFTDRELVATVTTNPGDALSRCWNKVVGRLTTGAFGDVTVLRANGAKSVWTQIVESFETDVRLVVYDGIPRYGEAALMNAAPALPSSPIMIRNKNYRFAIANPKDQSKAWTWPDITGALDAVRDDPVSALKKADAQRRAYAGPIDSSEAPLELVLDMPFGGPAMAGDITEHAADVVIPKLPSLLHDTAFFKSINGRGFHGGLLDKLAGFYP